MLSHYLYHYFILVSFRPFFPPIIQFCFYVFVIMIYMQFCTLIFISHEKHFSRLLHSLQSMPAEYFIQWIKKFSVRYLLSLLFY